MENILKESLACLSMSFILYLHKNHVMLFSLSFYVNNHADELFNI